MILKKIPILIIFLNFNCKNTHELNNTERSYTNINNLNLNNCYFYRIN